MKNIKLEQQEQLIDFDTLSKTIESTVVRAFKGLTKNLQNSLKLELEIPSDLKIKKDSLDRDIRRIQSDINNAFSRVQQELQSNIDDRWRFKKDRKGRSEDWIIKELEAHKNGRLEMIKSMATFGDDGSFKLNDPKDLRKFIQNVKAYEKDIKELISLHESNGKKYQLSENDIDLQKIFRGYKITNSDEANVSAMAKKLADIFKSQLNSQLASKKSEQVDLTQQINRAVARAAQKQEGVGYEYSREEYNKAVEKANAAKEDAEKAKLEIARIVQSEIDAYVEMQKKINDPKTSPSNVKLLKEKEEQNLGRLKSMLKIIDEYGLEVSRLSDPDLNDPQQTVLDRLQKITSPRGVSADKSFAKSQIDAYAAAKEASLFADRNVDEAQSYLDAFKQLLLSLKDTTEMREVVSDIADEQIQSSVQEFKTKITALESQVTDLKSQIAEFQKTGSAAHGSNDAGVNDEAGAVGKLSDSINAVTTAVKSKTDAFKDERDKVVGWIKEETDSVDSLNKSLSKASELLKSIDTPGGQGELGKSGKTSDWQSTLSKYNDPHIYDKSNPDRSMQDAFDTVHMLSDENRLFQRYIGQLSNDLARYQTKDVNGQELVDKLTQIGRLSSEINELEIELKNSSGINADKLQSELSQKSAELEGLKKSVDQVASYDKPVYDELVSQIMAWYQRVIHNEQILQDVLNQVKIDNPNNPDYADSLEAYFYKRVDPVKDAFDNQLAVTTKKGVASTQKRLSVEDDRRAIEAQRIINTDQVQIKKYEQIIEAGKRLTADEEKHLATLRDEVTEQQKILDAINASASAQEKLNALEKKGENNILGLEAKASREQLTKSEKDSVQAAKAEEKAKAEAAKARAEAQAEEAKNAEIESKAFIKAANDETQQYLTAVKTIVDTTDDFIKLTSKIGSGEDLQNEESVRYNQLIEQRQKAYDVISNSHVDPITIADSERQIADATELATARIRDEAKALEELEKAKAKAEADKLAKQQEAEAAKAQKEAEKAAKAEQKSLEERAAYYSRQIKANQAEISTLSSKRLTEGLTSSEEEHLRLLVDQTADAQNALNQLGVTTEKVARIEAERAKVADKAASKYKMGYEQQQAQAKAQQLAKDANDQQKAENAAAKNASDVIRKNYEQLERLRRKGSSDIGFTEEDFGLFQRLTKETEDAREALANSKVDSSVLAELAEQRAKEEDRVAAKLKEELDTQEKQKQIAMSRATSKMESDFAELDKNRLAMLRAQEKLNYDNSAEAQAQYDKARIKVDELTEAIRKNAAEAGISDDVVNGYFKNYESGATEAAARVKAEFENLRHSLGESLGTGFNVNGVKDALETWVSKHGGKELEKLYNAGIDKRGVNNFTAEFKDANGVVHQLKASLTQVNGELFVATDQGKQLTGAFSSFFDGIKSRLVNFAQYLSSFGSAWQVINTLRQGLSIVKELDAGFVELKRISNDSAAALESFRQESFKLADTVGTTANTITNAATEWEHLGYSIKDAAELAKTSAVYKNIADGMTSDSEATEDLVSIMKAYNKDASDAMDITDALIATSNNFAVTAADVGNILKRSSSALAMAGNSFEQTVAMGTAMQEVLQQAEVAGSSLKVLSLRLRSSKAELKDMGEETDDLVESTPKLRAQIKALTKGFDIFDEKENKIKDTYSIMKGIAEVWEDMENADQAALLELIAGKTRAQGVSALLSNWSQVDEVLKVIANDEGVALKNNEEKLNTIQGRLTKLINASQKLASDAFNTEVIKDFISVGTDAVNLLDAIINRIGTIPTAFGAIGAASTFTKGGGQLNQSSYPKWMKSYKAPGIVRGNTKQVHAF